MSKVNWHDVGQKDGSEGDYAPPHSSVAESLAGLFSSTETNERNTEAKREYDAGYQNAQKQRK